MAQLGFQITGFIFTLEAASLPNLGNILPNKMSLVCGVTAKQVVSRLHRVGKSSNAFNITEIGQLRRLEDEPNISNLKP